MIRPILWGLARATREEILYSVCSWSYDSLKATNHRKHSGAGSERARVCGLRDRFIMMRFAAAECMTDTDGDVAEFDVTALLHPWISPITDTESRYFGGMQTNGKRCAWERESVNVVGELKRQRQTAPDYQRFRMNCRTGGEATEVGDRGWGIRGVQTPTCFHGTARLAQI